MISEVYNAFKKAGIPDQEAQEAAEALLSENNKNKEITTTIQKNIEKLDKKIEINFTEIKAEAKITRWMIALIITIQVIPFLKSPIN